MHRLFISRGFSINTEDLTVYRVSSALLLYVSGGKEGERKRREGRDGRERKGEGKRVAGGGHTLDQNKILAAVTGILGPVVKSTVKETGEVRRRNFGSLS